MKLRRLALPILLAALCLHGAVAATPDDDELADLVRNPSIALYKAYAEFKMARYDSARRIWEALAERGVAESWFNLGILAEDGLGQPRDAAAALAAYEKGAAGGSAKAQYRLALIHLEGRLVPPDRALAQRWLERAAAAGYEDAAAQLAQLQAGAAADDYLAARLLESEGRATDAADIYRRLSDTGNLRARTRLAWLHEAGRGVPRNLERAATLFREAAEGGDAEAQFALAVMLETGAGLPRDEAAAREWLRRAALAGNAEAQEALRAREGR